VETDPLDNISSTDEDAEVANDDALEEYYSAVQARNFAHSLPESLEDLTIQKCSNTILTVLEFLFLDGNVLPSALRTVKVS